MTGDTIRVLIVDDDPLVRAGLRLILGGAPDVAIVGEAGDGAEGLDVAGRTSPDVVLMDIRMPRMGGLEATQRLSAGGAAPAVIVLTTFDAEEQVLRALQAGASGFLLKDTPPEAIIEAVRRVSAGEPMLSPSVTSTLIRQVTASSDEPRRRRAKAALADLTERELEVAVAVGHGKSNADIATELYMSVATVKAHVSRLLTKLGADNRVQIAIRVHDADLV